MAAKLISGLTKMTVLLIMVLSQATAQGTPEERVTLSVKNGSLESVLKEIGRQTGYSYALQDRWKAVAKPVTISVKDMEVEEVLDLCFKNQPFTYTVVSRTIVIEARKPLEPKDTVGAATIRPPDGIFGVVLNEEDKPLPGATVELKQLNLRQLADQNGSFHLKNLSAGKYDVEVSFVGYLKSRYVVIVRDKLVELTVNLRRDVGNLDEVQVIAYGTTTKRLNTGDVTTVTSKELETQPTDNPILALEALVPGMFIEQGTGMPGSGVTVQIRGLNSLANQEDPLYIIDGVPFNSEVTSINGIQGGINGAYGSSGSYSTSPFSYLNPADIQSVEVLKDADATAIYGSRGAAGVVLITTKKGKEGKTKFDVNIQNGFGKVAERMKLLNTREYLNMRYEAFKNGAAVPDPHADYDLTLWDTTRNTDWQTALTGNPAAYNDAEAKLTGGTATTQFLIGAGYHRETTVFQGNYNARKETVHFNINNQSPNHKFKIMLSGIYSLNNDILPGNDLTTASLVLPPDAPPLHNNDGTLNWAPNAVGVSTWPSGNPIAWASVGFETKTNNLVSSGVLSYAIFKGLEIKANFGYTNTQTNQIETIPLTSLDPSTWTYDQRTSIFGNQQNQTWITEPQVTYSNDFAGGRLTALIGGTIQQNASNFQRFIATGFSSDLVMRDLAAATSIQLIQQDPVYKYAALFARLNHNWHDKYLVNLTVRRDGSSRFGPANQYHAFGAVGAAWIFSKEGLVEKHLPFLSFGKIRASYGTTGSDQIGDYTFMDLYSPLSVGVPYQAAIGNYPNKIYTPNLAWEETKKIEVGSELGFLKDRIFFSASYYRNSSTNQLVQYDLPSIAGFASIQRNLPALVLNKGWEFEIKTTNISEKHFRWTTSFNLSINQNKLAAGAPGLDPYYAQKIGHQLLSLLVYHYTGVNPITGLYQFSSIHGGSTSSPDPATDQTTVVNLLADFYGGLQNTLVYKRVELDLTLQYVCRPNAPSYLYEGIPGNFGENQPVGVLQRWQNPGDVRPVQRFAADLSTLSTEMDARQSTQMYSNGSFIRLKNFSLSWTLPSQWQQKAGLTNARIYVHAQNLFTITHYKGLDPESAGPWTPPLRVISFGLQLIL